MTMDNGQPELLVYDDDALAAYSFGNGHPFGPQRFSAFYQRYQQLGLDQSVQHAKARQATEQQIKLFHTDDYVDEVKHKSQLGEGFLDYGDTPVFKGIFEAAAMVAGTVLDAVDQLVEQKARRAFIPIAGLHHARRHIAAGFCAFNDCGIAIEYLRQQHDIHKVAYVDIDAHHGDGVFYGFEQDPELYFADIHEDGRYLYPGTGFMNETGQGPALGTKLNLPMPMYADDNRFLRAWQQIEDYLHKAKPDFILFQCGADSLQGDPITHLAFTEKSHAYAAGRLRGIADDYAQGRLLAMGGGGYNLGNIAKAWCAVVNALI